MNEQTELLQKVMADLGFRTEFDEDGDLIFRYEMKTMYVITRYDDRFINIVFPRYYEVEEGQEATALFVSMKLTRDLKHIKTYLDSSMKEFSSSAEFWYTDEEDLKNAIEHALMMLGCVKTRVKEELAECLSSLDDDDSTDDETPDTDAETVA